MGGPVAGSAGAQPTFSRQSQYPAPTFAPAKIRADLEQLLLRTPGLERGPSRHGDGRSYFVGPMEIAHFRRNGRMDVRLPRQLIRDLKGKAVLDPMVHTRGPTTDWSTVPLDDEADVDLASEMVDLAMQANS
jgi:hypothetical protein